MSKALAVVQVRHQVVPETQDGQEEGEKVGERGGDKKKVTTLSKQLHIFVAIINPVLGDRYVQAFGVHCQPCQPCNLLSFHSCLLYFCHFVDVKLE